MTTTRAGAIRDYYRAYEADDRDAVERLLTGDFTFTSPQDDRIDRQAFFERCFPTADRISRQDLIHVVRAGHRDVFVLYEYDLVSGGTFRNAEVISVVGERIVEVQVFFGGQVA